ncbi:MAG: nucleotidyltransferase family protein [Bryobacteraceae bacterium]
MRPPHGILVIGVRLIYTLPITVPEELIAALCRRNQIRKLSFFGSVLTPRFRPESDVDMLVEFEEDARPSLLTMARLERELSELLGRKVDLRTAGDLSRYFRREVVSAAFPQYEQS